MLTVLTLAVAQPSGPQTAPSPIIPCQPAVGGLSTCPVGLTCCRFTTPDPLLLGHCYNASTQRCCDGAETICWNYQACCNYDRSLLPFPSSIRNARNDPVAPGLNSTGACMDPRFQTCCATGYVANSNYETCCNDTACNTYNEQCNTVTLYNGYKKSTCSRDREVSTLGRGVVVVGIPLIFGFAWWCLVFYMIMLYLTQPSARLINIVTIVFNFVAMLFFWFLLFSPIWTWALIVTTTGVVTIGLLAAHRHTGFTVDKAWVSPSRVALLVQVFLLFSLFDIGFTAFSNNTGGGGPLATLKNDVLHAEVGYTTPGDSYGLAGPGNEGVRTCAEYYWGFFTRSTSKYDATQMNPQAWQWGLCSREWLSFLVVFTTLGISLELFVLVGLGYVSVQNWHLSGHESTKLSG